MLVPSGQQAGLITAIYIVSYVALGTAVIGGVTTTVYGLHATALVYSVVVADSPRRLRLSSWSAGRAPRVSARSRDRDPGPAACLNRLPR